MVEDYLTMAHKLEREYFIYLNLANIKAIYAIG